MSNISSNRLFRKLLKWGMAGSVVGAGITTAAVAYSHYVEPFDIELERIPIRLARAHGKLPKSGLRILQLSDSHFHGGKRTLRERTKIETVRRLTADLEYDLLIHTGDFWHDSEGLDNILALLDAVPKPRLGSFGVFGNHDYAHFDMGVAPKRMWKTYNERVPLKDPTPIRFVKHVLNWIVYFRNTPLDGPPTQSNDANGLRTVLEDWGMRILHNEAIHLQGLVENNTAVRPSRTTWHTNGQTISNGAADSAIQTAIAAASKAASEPVDIYLAGVDDWAMGRPNMAKAIRGIPAEAPLILLSHNPDIIEDSNFNRADLVISGHTHGGQLVVPFWGPAHTQSAQLGRHEVAGYTRRGKTQIYISRGLGEGIPLRFMAHPQITLITIKE